MAGKHISTYVFLDLETTGLPREELNKTKITELSVIAVKRWHLLHTEPKFRPRVQQKLSLCLNPGRMIQPSCTEVTGLDNELLEHETMFDINVFNILNGFLKILTKPVCLIAQNGLRFDFPILKAQLEKLNVNFSEDLMCADCYHGFYHILEGTKQDNSFHNVKNGENQSKEVEQMSIEHESTSLYESFPEEVSLQSSNEVTPKKTINHIEAVTPKKSSNIYPRMACNQISKACRRFPWSSGSKPTKSYKLKNIYERVVKQPCLEAHQAENDCLMALECSVVLAKGFVKWIDENYIPFAEVKPMRIGVRVGE